MSVRFKNRLLASPGLPMVLIMAITMVLPVVLEAAPALAKPAWVDGLRITVRRGPSVEYRIRDFLPSGSRVEILGSKEGWTRVRLAGGGTGWVLSRYLTDEKPLAARLEASQIQANKLTKQLDLAGDENSELRRQVDEMEQQQAQIEERLDRERQARLEEYRQALSIADGLIEKQRQKKKALTGTKSFSGDLIVWFLTGAVVAALGLILGGLSGRISFKRRRSPSLA